MEDTKPTTKPMPKTDTVRMDRIEFAVPSPLLDEALTLAEADGFKPAEFHRQIWLEGLFAYAEKSNKVLVNRSLRRKAEGWGDRD